MNTYLTIMVTVLVATQIIRITQNAIQLHHQEKKINDAVSWIKDNDVSQRDFQVQRDCFYLLQIWLEKELDIDYGAELCDEEKEGE